MKEILPEIVVSYSISVLWQLVSMLKFEFAVKSKFVLCILNGGECGLVK